MGGAQTAVVGHVKGMRNFSRKSWSEDTNRGRSRWWMGNINNEFREISYEDTSFIEMS